MRENVLVGDDRQWPVGHSSHVAFNVVRHRERELLYMGERWRPTRISAQVSISMRQREKKKNIFPNGAVQAVKPWGPGGSANRTKVTTSTTTMER